MSPVTVPNWLKKKVPWQDVCAYIYRQDDWMRDMSAWAHDVDVWIALHNGGTGTPPPPQPPAKNWP